MYPRKSGEKKIDTSKKYIAIVSPSFPAALVGPEVHEQAMLRIQSEFALPVREFPSVRQRCSSRERANEINQASADPNCYALFAVIGGNDCITLLKHFDDQVLRSSNTPFVGYSDNTAIHNYLWKLGKVSYYGGSTQLQLGAGPAIDPAQLESLTRIIGGHGQLRIEEPTEYEVRGKRWQSPSALTQTGLRAAFPGFIWGGESTIKRGVTWGGCLQVLIQLSILRQLPSSTQLRDSILVIELSDEQLGDGNVVKLIRALGEAGYFNSVAALLFGMPPHSSLTDEGEVKPDSTSAVQLLHSISDIVNLYNPQLLRVLGVPIGHLRPQYIIPYGGTMVIDGKTKTITALYGEEIHPNQRLKNPSP